jgi:hypothetical protein
VEQPTLRGDLILAQLENLISKLKLQSPDFADLDLRVYPGHAGRCSFVIDVSKGRFARRVIVDPKTAKHLQPEHFDSNLAREVRTAMLTVARWAQDRK